MENGRKFLDLCCDICVDNVAAGCGWVDSWSRLNVVSIVTFRNNTECYQPTDLFLKPSLTFPTVRRTGRIRISQEF
jgi:hypothetical protein